MSSHILSFAQLRRNFWRIWVNIKKLLILTSENHPVTVARFIVSKFRKSKEPMLLSFLRRQLWIRPSTPDLNVAYSCFSGEFSPLSTLPVPDEGALIIDAGGYIGTAALALSEMFPQCIIVSIEPSIENYSLLEKNTASNKRIKPVLAALVAMKQDAPRFLCDIGRGEWGYSIVNEPHGPVGGEAITIVTFSDIFASIGVDEAFIVKMDIEGSEKDLLDRHELWIDRVLALFIELHPEIDQNIENLYQIATMQRDHQITDGEKMFTIRVNGRA